MWLNGWEVLRATSCFPLIKEGPGWSEHHKMRVGPSVCGVKWELQEQDISENLKPPFPQSKELRGQKKMNKGP